MQDVLACVSAEKLCVQVVVALKLLVESPAWQEWIWDIVKGYKQRYNGSTRFQSASEGMKHQLEWILATLDEAEVAW